MDWASIWENLSGQGIMFWSATLAVALGITLILAAGHIQWRRRSRPAKRATLVQAPKPAALPNPAPAPPERDRHPENLIIPPHSLTTISGQDHLEIEVLMARLRSAADRLAAHHGSHLQIPTNKRDSHLKEGHTGVEYLFRAGKG